ncbi:polysaccharide biosynthesis protein [Streptomyces sp. CHD11]|uniref:Wzz/FepE/Etk N-terminal domain-containing protein n=1 Tax=Streptomyces sp. CHD11 TaxID=2741325 RepID=UPI001BFC2A35|nr:Wzz/FepE/Etk N-terminal domain-containing protein [Streptomyces sp. CHD11]MBT3153863.1 polysaccharide biosynthesis protein [Streptomyces sp. CHD11]
MTTPVTPDPPASAPLLDLQALVVSVRRRRRLWGSTALLGLLLGATVAVLLPPPPTAVAKVLVAHQQDQPNDPGTLIRTDAALLHTTRIAGAALRSLESPEKPEDFLADYEGRGLTNNLLQITVTGDSDAQAVARAGALADAFVADHVRRMREAADAEARSLLDQRERLREELDQVNEAIGDESDGSPPQGGAQDSASMESLFARRAELTSRITDFGQRAAEARVGTPRLVAATQIVDAPRVVRHSLPGTAGTNAAIGLVLGLALGLAVAAVASVVADRPVLRRDVAANLGASVIAELPRRPARLWRRRRSRAARARLTTSLARTVRGSTEPVSLLELGCARGASLIALDLARFLAREEPVVVIDGLPGSRLSGHRREPGDPPVTGTEQAHAIPGTLAGPHPGGGLPAPAEPAAAGGEPVPAGGRRLGVGSVAPGTAWADLRYLGTRTVLVVRAGHGSAAWLHTVARQLADLRIAVIGVVLTDPDPRDRTDGTLWDGPHTALRGGSEPAARRNGGGTSHAVQAAGEGPRRAERLPTPAARVPDSDQEAR